MPVLVMGRDSNFTETGLKETILATNQNNQRNVIEMGVLDISLITICGCSCDLTEMALGRINSPAVRRSSKITKWLTVGWSYSE